MGKASSNKKVARAAGTGGGRTGGTNAPWVYFGLLALIVVVGVVLTTTSRSRYEDQLTAAKTSNASVAPKVGGTAWNEAVGFYVCGSFQSPIKVASNKEGLTTDGNGVIHIAPKTKAVAGKNATLGAFANAVGLTLTGDTLQLPGGKKYTNGDKCSGQPGKLYVKQFDFVGATSGAIQTADPRDVRLANNALVTVAFVSAAQKGKIPAPPASAQSALKKAAVAATTTTTTTTTTAPTTTTTTPASSTTTGSTKSASSSTTSTTS